METEIEIKFFFNADFSDNLLQEITQHKVISHKDQMLYNTYFDTADRALRKMDMGLRIRRIEDQYTQTIKTSGRVIGGLHQRPEYNEIVVGMEPQLIKFKREIWPEDCDLVTLQEQLTPLFSTHFRRLHWLLEMQEGTLIEVAYDCGQIIAGQRESTICEIELELIKGDEAQLFVLAEKIAHLPHVRLGNISKAQRGYMLTENSHFLVKSIEFSKLNTKMTLQQALLTNFQHGLKHLQYHENSYIEQGDIQALIQLQKSIMFLHQNIHLFRQAGVSFNGCRWIADLQWLARSFSWIDEKCVLQNLLENKAYYLRKLPKLKQLKKNISLAEQALPNQEDIVNLLNSTRYCQFILRLTEWLITFEKMPQTDNVTHSLVTFAKAILTESWAKLTLPLTSAGTLALENLLPHQGTLVANLMTGLSLGTLFDSKKCAEYRYPWLDIYQGLLELSMLNTVYELALDEEDSDIQHEYLKWVKRKQNSLLNAIEQSKQRALKNEMYWIDLEH